MLEDQTKMEKHNTILKKIDFGNFAKREMLRYKNANEPIIYEDGEKIYSGDAVIIRRDTGYALYLHNQQEHYLTKLCAILRPYIKDIRLLSEYDKTYNKLLNDKIVFQHMTKGNQSLHKQEVGHARLDDCLIKIKMLRKNINNLLPSNFLLNQ